MHIAIRVDVTPTMGMGHFMRCFAFSQWCKRYNISSFFIFANMTEAVRAILAQHDVPYRVLSQKAGSIDDAHATLSKITENKSTWLLLDGYHFSDAYFTFFSQTPIKIIAIDDFGAAKDYPEIVINYQPWASAQWYSSCRKQFLGLDYFLAREAFWPYLRWEKPGNNDNKHIVVIMGGTDPQGFTEKIVRAIEKIEQCALQVSIIMSQPNTVVNEIVAHNRSHHTMEVHINPRDMALLMSKADLAITAGGGTCWELMFMKVPCVIIAQAENQRGVVEYIVKHSLGIDLGNHYDTVESELKEKLAALLCNNSKQIAMTENIRSIKIAHKTEEIFEYIRTYHA